MSSIHLVQIAFLLGALFVGSGRSQRCNVSGVAPVPNFDLERFTGNNYWYLQEIIVRDAEDYYGEPQHACYSQTVSPSEEADLYLMIGDQWRNVSAGYTDFHLGITTSYLLTPAIWRVQWQNPFYTGVWVNTDYDNYAVQYYCPEDMHYHPYSMMLWTRNWTVDPKLLDVLEGIAEGHGYSREYAIKLNNTDCEDRRG